MKPSRPKYCKDCALFHNANRTNPVGGLEKYNAWCCAKGAPASDSVGWCKLHGKRKLKNIKQG